ncbi:MAG: hypothetical protein AAF608_06565 [Pseudomonadota bacterium]
MMRQFERESFLYRNSGYTVQLRPREGERYLLVTADPELVGKTYKSVETGINASSYSTGYGAATLYSGINTETTRVFSYEGRVNVVVLIPKAVVDQMREE